MKHLLCLFGIVLLTGCGSPATVRSVSIPGSVVSDDIVIPADVAPAYQQLSEEINNLYFEHWKLLSERATAASQPLNERRALVYDNFGHIYFPERGVDDVLEIETFAGGESELTALCATIADRVGFKVESSSYDDWPGTPDGSHVNDDYRSLRCTLKARRALSAGELAWVADWIMTNYSRQILSVGPQDKVWPTS